MSRKRKLTVSDGPVTVTTVTAKKGKSSSSSSVPIVKGYALPARGYTKRSKAESKYVDIGPFASVADTTGAIVLLNGAALGDDATDREGRQTYATSVHIQGILTPTDTTNNDTLCRMLLVWDKAPNGVAPTFGELMTAADPVMQLNLNNRARFTVLADKRWALGARDLATAGNKVASGQASHVVNIFRKLKNLKTQWMGTGATIASIQSGALYLFMVGDQATTDSGQFRLTSRVRFHE